MLELDRLADSVSPEGILEYGTQIIEVDRVFVRVDMDM